MFLANLVAICLRIIRCVLYPFYALLHFRKPPKIPSIKNPLLLNSGTTLANKIRRGEISSQTAVEAYIERIKEVNPFLNAVVDEQFEVALSTAKIYDEKLKTGEVSIAMLEKEKPLYGVPVTIKESCSLEGMSFTGGTFSKKGDKAIEDGPAVELLKDAGAIPLCVTNTPEFCLGIHTVNVIYGNTKNPYDTRISPGASSGGEGALLGAGASILGLGTDLMGSIRLPSFCNGVFGHKPTPGIVPNQKHLPTLDNTSLGPLLVFGPMTRYAEDLHLAMTVLTSKCEVPLHLDEPVDLKNLRVYYLDNINSVFGIRSTSSDVRQIIKQGAHYLKENGAYVEKLSQRFVRNAFMFLMSCFLATDLPEILMDFKHPERKKHVLLEFLKVLFGFSDFTLQLIFGRLMILFHGFLPRSRTNYYRTVTNNTIQELNNLLGDNGVIISPTFPRQPGISELCVLNSDCIKYTTIWNVLKLPATHVPMGLDSNGLPIGFQVVGGSHQDRLCLAVARELEKGFGGWRPPSS
ncbi:fatty-acid amide hydrolase 2-A-like [Ptiloglossa arizonensis]|uniref:fatty-acid amide hydrolase 2-A-like n=1 Tax=Ptiloglossa arizonensis TaxID=3350558 RepID=UPI003FA0D8DE